MENDRETISDITDAVCVLNLAAGKVTESAEETEIKDRNKLCML